MDAKVMRFLAIAFGWPLLVAAVIAMAHIPLGSPLGIGIIALLYMPAPAVAALIVERRVVRARLRFPNGSNWRTIVWFFALPMVVVVSLAAALLLLTALLGNWLALTAFGSVVTSIAEFRANLSLSYGSALSEQANLPNSLVALFALTFLSAAVAGWSINGLFALGEEYGWRGFLWEAWQRHGIVRANLAIGVVWGLWHAPLIVQGYNYPGHPFGGVLLMVCFAIAASFVLTAIRELTGSVLSAAVTHGAINAVASLLTLMVVGGNPLLSGPLGVSGSLALSLVALPLWMTVRRKQRLVVGSGQSELHARSAAAHA
ncbi:MAG TPA: CPBP family intramembrane glutamic endopeptidase [Thermomicrobiales bacterium]|jgi:membrane protease YdiL (CAAX protease family)